MNLTISDEAAMLALGRRLAQGCSRDAVIYLRGKLGAGKTTLVRGFMDAMGYRGAVKSPTYTLIEPYEVGGRHFYHLDLYRIEEAAELEYLGLRELHEGDGVMLVEWPERWERKLPPADIVLDIQHQGSERRVDIKAATDAGMAMQEALGADFSSG